MTSRLLREVSLLRIVAQGLVPATGSGDVVEVVRRQLAMQGQLASAVPQALLVRAPAATGSQAQAAFADGHLVRGWPMRGTLHITSAADHHWLRETLVHRYQRWVAADMRDSQLSETAIERAAQVAHDLIAAQGPTSRADIVQALGEAGQLVASDDQARRPRFMIQHLVFRGQLVGGPRQGGDHLFVDARDLPSANTGPGGAEGCAYGQPGHRLALAEIARRYATSHGPVSAADLARWIGLPSEQARQALEDAVAETTGQGYAAAPDRGQVALTRLKLAQDRLVAAQPGAKDCLYLRADLVDLLAESRKAAAATHFFGHFDELYVGYRDRTCLTDATGDALINPGKNGMLKPMLVDRGRLVAVRPHVGGEIAWLAENPSARLARDVQRAIGRMERRLAK